MKKSISVMGLVRIGIFDHYVIGQKKVRFKILMVMASFCVYIYTANATIHALKYYDWAALRISYIVILFLA